MGWIISYRWWIIFASLMFTVLVASGMQHLAFNPDSRVFFSEENPQLVALEELESTFIKNERVFSAQASGWLNL
jgi:predicted RND superfamily exporter protein